MLFVAVEAKRRGYRVTSDARGVDMTVSGWAVQVCATQEADDEDWMVSPRHERERRPDLMFVFVRFNGLSAPAYHIAPGAETVRQMAAGHEKWRASPGRHGRRRNYSSVRLFRDPKNEYLDKWDLFAAPPGKAEARKAEAAKRKPTKRKPTKRKPAKRKPTKRKPHRAQI